MKKVILKCEFCGKSSPEEDLWETMEGCFLCSECAEDHAFRCDACGEFILHDYTIDDLGYVYCENCWDDSEMEEPEDFMGAAHAAAEDKLCGY